LVKSPLASVSRKVSKKLSRVEPLVAGACVAFLLSLPGCGGASSPTAVPTPVAVVPTPPPLPKVALISIDGLRADALSKAQAPEIRKLMARGVYTLRGRTVMPAMTLPAHTSMITGLDPSVHKILWDEYKPDKGTISVSTVFSIAKAAGKRTVAVVGKDKFKTLNVPGSIDSFLVVGGGVVYLVARRWTEQASANRPVADPAYAERVRRELKNREQA